MARAKIISTGMAVPDRVLTNFDLEKIVDTSDEWIRERTGIVERRLTDENTAASDLALTASQQALENAGIEASDLDAILVATISSDYAWPATACILQNKLGIKNIMAVDLSAACSGFIYGLSVAQAYVESGMYKNILLVGVDCLAKVVDWTDRNTCVLFGDGAGAVVIQSNDSEKGILGSVLGADGSIAELLCQRCGGSKVPITEQAIQDKQHYIYMNGRDIFKNAVRSMSQACKDVLKQCGLEKDDVKLLIPHQANIRIIEAVAQRLRLPMDLFYVNLQKYGNTSAATIPMALHEAMEEKRLQEGDLAVFVAFGGGMTWGACAVQF